MNQARQAAAIADLRRATAEVCLVAPLPAQGRQSGGGVATYTASLVRHLPGEWIGRLRVVANRQCPVGAYPESKIVAAWTPGWRAPTQIRKALRSNPQSLIHLQHEFRLFGNPLVTNRVVSSLREFRADGTRIVITLHGVFEPSVLEDHWKGWAGWRLLRPLASTALTASFGEVAAVSDLVIVHHETFRDLLISCYGVHPAAVAVVPLGAAAAAPRGGDWVQKAQPRVLVFGFLTPYKRPELVVDLAESDLLPQAVFEFCIGEHPRDHSMRQRRRYDALRKRVIALGNRGIWRGFVPDELVPETFDRADVLVLPYAECVSSSAVAALAVEHGVPMCFASPLRPFFGRGELEFQLTPTDLRRAILAALDQRSTRFASPSPFAPWSETSARTADLWHGLITGTRAVD